jgi:hypothetical protein
MRGSARCAVVCGPGRAEPVGPPAAGEVCLSVLCSAISRGAERLVLNGRVPRASTRMRAPNMAAAFPFRVKDGYAAVGGIGHRGAGSGGFLPALSSNSHAFHSAV